MEVDMSIKLPSSFNPLNWGRPKTDKKESSNVGKKESSNIEEKGKLNLEQKASVAANKVLGTISDVGQGIYKFVKKCTQGDPDKKQVKAANINSGKVETREPYEVKLRLYGGKISESSNIIEDTLNNALESKLTPKEFCTQIPRLLGDIGKTASYDGRQDSVSTNKISLIRQEMLLTLCDKLTDNPEFSEKCTPADKDALNDVVKHCLSDPRQTKEVKDKAREFQAKIGITPSPEDEIPPFLFK